MKTWTELFTMWLTMVCLTSLAVLEIVKGNAAVATPLVALVISAGGVIITRAGANSGATEKAMGAATAFVEAAAKLDTFVKEHATVAAALKDAVQEAAKLLPSADGKKGP